MNDIERRTLIGAAGIGAIAALAKAGPLNPPAGAVAPTGRTTDEIYNKIPAIGGSDGRTPVSSGAFAINAPGSYVLTADLSSAGNTLFIAASNVTVDLNGFTVFATGTTVPAVTISGTRSNITIRNGSVDGGATGVSTTTGVTNVLIEDLRVSNAKALGINIGSANSRGCVIRRCTVESTGSTTVAADGNLTISGIIVAGSSCRIDQCVVSRLFYNGGGVGTFRAISFNNGAGFGNVVSRCTVSHDAAIAGTGVIVGGTTVYRDNTVLGFSTAYSGGTNGGGNV